MSNFHFINDIILLDFCNPDDVAVLFKYLCHKDIRLSFHKRNMVWKFSKLNLKVLVKKKIEKHKTQNFSESSKFKICAKNTARVIAINI